MLASERQAGGLAIEMKFKAVVRVDLSEKGTMQNNTYAYWEVTIGMIHTGLCLCFSEHIYI